MSAAVVNNKLLQPQNAQTHRIPLLQTTNYQSLLATSEKIECWICFEEKPRPDQAQKLDHLTPQLCTMLDDICAECLSGIEMRGNRCPNCREPLKKHSVQISILEVKNNVRVENNPGVQNERIQSCFQRHRRLAQCAGCIGVLGVASIAVGVLGALGYIR